MTMPFSRGTLGFFVVLAGLGAWMALLGEPREHVMAASEFHRITPVDLARALVEGRMNTAVVDLTPAAEEHHFRNTLKVEADKPALPQALAFLGTNRAQHVVLVGRDEPALLKLGTALTRKRFTVLLLEGGLSAWEKDVLNPTLPAEATPAQREAHAALLSLSAYLQGKGLVATDAAAPPPTEKVVRKPRAPAAGGGGGC